MMHKKKSKKLGASARKKIVASGAYRARLVKVAPSRPKTDEEKRVAKLHHPAKWASLARWQLAVERVYGPHHVDWPPWALALLVRHVGEDLKRAGYG